MKKTLKEIVKIVGGEIIGDDSAVITGVCGIEEAERGDITFVANPKYAPLINTTGASAIITSREIESAPKPIIRTDNPSLAFTRIVELIASSNTMHPKGIHKSAVLGEGVKLGKDISLGPYVVVEDNVSIADGSVIYSGSFIGHDTSIGKNVVIYPNVSIRENITVGDRVVIHSGAVIGSDGFGFVKVKDVHYKIPQRGVVVIEDDVEIGANVAIDRARFDKTVIGAGTKIDNLVQIAHNVTVGRNSLIVSQAGISGSTHIGDNVTIAGQAGLVGHITVGDEAIIAAQAGVTKSVRPKAMVSGYPAKPHREAKRVNACIQMLPRLFGTVKELRKKIEELEKKLEELEK